MGATAAKGTRRIEAKIGTVVSTSTRPTTLPRYIESIRPQTKSLCCTNRRGTGMMAHTILVLDEQQRTRVEAPHHQAAEQNRGRTRARDAERQHRQQRRGTGSVR